MNPGRSMHGCVTGKPLAQGGIRGRREADGPRRLSRLRGSCNHARIGRHSVDGGPAGKRVIVQGLGNVVISGKFCPRGRPIIVPSLNGEARLSIPMAYTKRVFNTAMRPARYRLPRRGNTSTPRALESTARLIPRARKPDHRRERRPHQGENHVKAHRPHHSRSEEILLKKGV